jgi:hypothetical protein
LTGLPAGKLRKDGTYPPNTVYRKVTDALEAMTRRAAEVSRAAAAREPVGALSVTPSADGDQAAPRKRKVRRGAGP